MTERTTQPEELTVSCHVRAPLLLDPVDAKIETLRSCEDEGEIDALVLRSWPEEVTLDADGPYQEAVERFEEFERWADRHGTSIRPPFRVRTSTSPASETEREVLVTPVMCLALYADDRLLGVFPHEDGETTHTVTDAIAALRTGTLPEPIRATADRVADAGAGTPDRRDGTELGGPELRDRSETGEARTVRTDCPECSAALLNVQGILACSACKWLDPDRARQRTTTIR